MRQGLRPLTWYRDLHDHSRRREEEAFLVEGSRALSQILQARPGAVIEILVAEGETFAAAAGRPVRAVQRSRLKPLCPSLHPAGPLAAVAMPPDVYSETAPADPGTRILLLEHVQDPGNVGTLIRTAAAFDFNGVVMSDQCADPFSPKVVAASAGTVLSVWIRRTPRYLALVDRLCRDRGFAIAATNMDGKRAAGLAGIERLVLALGNEGCGLSDELVRRAALVVGIPMNRDRAESLNVAASGAVCMYLARSDGDA